MNRVVIYTPVDLNEADAFAEKKTPLTELVLASSRDHTPRSAHLTLDVIRARLVDTDSLEEFETTNEHKGIFGWFERRRKAAAEIPARRTDSITVLTAATVFASSQR